MASASGSMLVVPQSTVTSSLTPRSANDADRVDIRAVAFEDAVGNMHDRIEPAVPQITRQQRRGGGAVDVVIAEDRDAFSPRVTASAMRAAAACHVGERVRVRHQPLDGRIEKGLDLVGLDAAAGQHARQQFGQAVPLRDGERARTAALVEPVAPGAPGRRALDAEEEALGGLSTPLRGRCRHRRYARAF